jgi:hypothetical protein
MKKQLIPLISAFLISFFLVSPVQAKVDNKELLGEWVYQVSEAPYGYEKGSLIFSEKDGKTTGIVKLEAGELQISELKIVKDSVSFVTYVDGSPINVKLIMNEKKLTGTVDSPEGPKTIVAEKKKK